MHKKNEEIVIQVVPDGIPDHIYNFPEQYDFEDCGGRYTHVYVKNKVSGKWRGRRGEGLNGGTSITLNTYFLDCITLNT